MHFLITNDDGIRAEGLRQLVRAALAKGHRVTVCAPDRERSAVSHALSISGALHVREVDVEGARGYETDGTPADCARLGVYLLRNDAPDLVISGINRGPNLGGACIYSGTVNAAMEASMAGRPALAASLRSFTSSDYSVAAEITLRVAEWALKNPLPRGAQKLAPMFLSDARYESFQSEYKHTFYFLTDGENPHAFPEDSDDALNERGWATVSALSWDISLRQGMPPIDVKL